MFKVNNKDTRMTPFGVVLVSLFLILNNSHFVLVFQLLNFNIAGLDIGFLSLALWLVSAIFL